MEHWRTAGDGAELATAVGQLQLGEDSGLAWLRLQRLGDGSVALSRSTLQLERGSALELLALDRGGELVRGEWRAALRGREARCMVSGVARVTGARHLEHALEVRHLAPATAAEVRFRGVAEDRGRAVFTGTLYVAPGADGTETRLSSRNLLLSPQAEIDTRPVLEIHNDEVVAGHGATVGQLDPEALFYLRSRGIPEAAARALLIEAFLGELLAGVTDPELAAQLAAELGSVGATPGSEDRE
ncbi:MAG: SufD family Fe-S cluster assembly protein [Xanthomonadales bacterium]|nr:SufD family Fe-S cluster assembly protein [Xanthomonadales bacterium]